MNNTIQNPGSALIIIDGLIAKETAKLRRHIEKLGGRKIITNTYIKSCPKMADLETLKEKLLAKGTYETSIRLYYLTAKQARDSIIVHGKAS